MHLKISLCFYVRFQIKEFDRHSRGELFGEEIDDLELILIEVNQKQ